MKNLYLEERNFVIFSDSSCDLPEQIQANFKVNIVPFYVSFDDKEYLRQGIDISLNSFYKKLSTSSTLPKTSLPSVKDYITFFKPSLKKGFDILCICISSKLSGSFQSAFNARNILLEEFPESKIIILDSEQATVGQGLLLTEALLMKKRGFKIEKVYDILEKIKKTATIYFLPETLDYLQKGGRIGKASAIAGNLLNIKPILHLENGEVSLKSKVRGKQKAIDEIISFLEEIPEKELEDYKIAVANTACREEARELLEKIEDSLDIRINIPIFDVGVTIATHVGPNALGVGIIKRYDAI